MAMQSPFPHVRVTGLGLRVNATSTSAPFTLPLAGDGGFPRYCRLMAEPSSGGTAAFAYIQVGGAAVTAQSGNLLITSHESQIIQTRGMTNIAVYNPTTTAFINVIPLEDA